MFTQISRILLLVIPIVFGSKHVWAQPEITFSSKSHDFGQIAEGTVAEIAFTFTNTGDQPLVLGEIRASCGCTTPFWTKEPVLPGRKGEIKASYNSKNRPGPFNKTITVNSNGIPRSQALYIKGTVTKLSQQQKNHTAAEKAASPILVIENTKLYQLGKVEISKATPVRVLVSNKGKSILEIRGIDSDCACVNFLNDELPVIQPGRTKPITLVYRPTTIGKTAVQASLLSNDIRQPKQSFEIQSDVIKLLESPVKLKEGTSKLSF